MKKKIKIFSAYASSLQNEAQEWLDTLSINAEIMKQSYHSGNLVLTFVYTDID